jgi:preprotein translocase subunit SecA
VQDADEAQAVARAGEAGRVTVTTNLAGRGTDIRLSEAARAAGGLHVILALSNRSRRIDRQLAGRSARHGDPGSAQALSSLDDGVIAQALGARGRSALARLADAQGELPGALAVMLAALAQRQSEWRERLLRRDLRLLDEGQGEQLAFSGRQE